MSAEIDYVAVRDDLKKRIEQLQAALVGVEGIIASSGMIGSSGAQRVTSAQDIARDEFLEMSIPDAAKKYLEMVRSPQTIGQIHEAIKNGGLPHTKYNAVYTAIWRRESPDGDFARVDENLWGLAAWYRTIPNVKKKAKPTKSPESDKPAPTPTQTTPQISRKRGGVTMLDACEQILRDEGKSLHAEVFVERLETKYGKKTNVKSIAGTLPGDGKKRFENLGRNVWALAEWPLAQKQLPLE